MTDLTPLSQALTLDGSYTHECIWITWKFNKSVNQNYTTHRNSAVFTEFKIPATKLAYWLKQPHIASSLLIAV